MIRNQSMMLVRCIFALAMTGCAVHLPKSHGDKIAFNPDARQNLTGLRIMDAVTGTAEIAKVGEEWVIPESGFPVDPEKINTALEHLFGLASHKGQRVAGLKGANEEEAYGLTLDRAKFVDLIFGKHEMRLRLGMAGEDYETTYWTREKEDGIFRASNNRVWGISAAPSYWKSRVVIPQFGPGNDIRELNVSWIDSAQNWQSYRLVRVGADSAIVIGQDTLGVVPQKARELIVHTRQFLADDFILDSEVEKPGSSRQGDIPLASVEVVLENGDRIGTRAFKGDDEHYYATNPSGYLVKVYKWRFKALLVSKASLTSGVQLGPAEDDGTEGHFMPPGFGVFMPHFHNLKEKSHPAEDEHDHDHSQHGHGHDHSGDNHDH